MKIRIIKNKTYINFKMMKESVDVGVLRKKRGTTTSILQFIGIIVLAVAFFLIIALIFKEKLAKLLISNYG